MRVLLDANIWISALLWRGTPLALVEAVRAANWQIVTTPAVLKEIDGVLRRPKFAPALKRIGLSPGEIRTLIEPLTLELPDRPHPRALVVRDPFDQYIIAAALHHKVAAIVSGDNDLLSLNSVAGVPILNPKELLDLLRGQ